MALKGKKDRLLADEAEVRRLRAEAEAIRRKATLVEQLAATTEAYEVPSSRYGHVHVHVHGSRYGHALAIYAYACGHGHGHAYAHVHARGTHIHLSTWQLACCSTAIRLQ